MTPPKTTAHPISTAVSFSPELMGAFAKGMVDYPASRVKEDFYPITIDGKTFELLVNGERIRELSLIHPSYWNPHMKVPEEYRLYTFLVTDEDSSEACLVDLDHTDLEAFFYVLDKVIAGADPVSLDGTLMVKKVQLKTESVSELDVTR